MPKAWVRERKRDHYYRKAVGEGYRSRATYKLFQAVEKFKFIREGDVVVDLGAAPGGWIQAVREIVGSDGFVLGVDLNYINPVPETNVKIIQNDITEEITLNQILKLLPRKADAVISDASPSISGVWEVDHARQIDLAFHALQIATSTLRVSGSFFIKVFQGDLLDDFVRKVKNHFKIVRIFKPKASRSKSSETFLIGLKMRLN